MAADADVIASIRELIDDQIGSKTIYNENLKKSIQGNQVDGSTKDFKLNNRRLEVVSSVVQLLVSADGGAFSLPGTNDPAKGTFSLGSAPATSLLARYNYQYFTDAELTSFLTNGLNFLGITATAQVPLGLIHPLALWGAADASQALSSRSGPLYNASAGGKTAQKDSIKKHYLELSKEYRKNAVDEREMFYMRKGQRNAPAFGKFALKNTPYTPIA